MTFHTIPYFYKRVLDVLFEQGLIQYTEDGIFRQYYFTHNNHKVITYFFYDNQLKSYCCEWQHGCFRKIKEYIIDKSYMYDIYGDNEKFPLYKIETNEIYDCCLILEFFNIVHFNYYYTNVNPENEYIKTQVVLTKNNKPVLTIYYPDSSFINTWDEDFFDKIKPFIKKLSDGN